MNEEPAYQPKMDEAAKRRLVRARDPNTSPNELAKLLEDENDKVSLAAAENHNLPTSCLEAGSKSKSWIVRSNVADCSRTQPHILDELSRDPNDVVQMAVATNPHTPHDTLRYLARHGLTDAPLFLAGNPNAPEDVLDYLSRLECQDNPRFILNMRSMIENNPGTPPHILERVKGATKALDNLIARESGKFTNTD